jgi:hypothetical protein
MKHQASESEPPEGLADRINALEVKYETMRRAVLDWGKDVDAVKRWSDDHLKRIMALESVQQQELDGLVQLLRSALQPPSNGPSHEAKPDDWLVYRVYDAVNSKVDITVDDVLESSRVAILEVAAWLREQHDGDPVEATLLEKEANQ